MTVTVHPSRRHVLRGGLLGAAAGLTAAGPAGCTGVGAAGESAPTFVLVHTGYAAASWWSGTVAQLALRGHRALAVDLPGHGGDAYYPRAYQAPQDPARLRSEPSPAAALTARHYADRVVDVVRRAGERGPVVLAGHGDAGAAAITLAGNALPDTIAHLVYVDAYLCTGMPTIGDYLATPENGDALLAPVVPTPPELGVARCNWRSGDAGDLDRFRAALAEGFDDAALRATLDSLSPDVDVELWGADVRAQAPTWGRIPRTWIRFTRDRTIPPALQDRMIAEADALTPHNRFAVHDVPLPHVGPLDHPGVVDVLHGLA